MNQVFSVTYLDMFVDIIGEDGNKTTVKCPFTVHRPVEAPNALAALVISVANDMMDKGLNPKQAIGLSGSFSVNKKG